MESSFTAAKEFEEDQRGDVSIDGCLEEDGDGLFPPPAATEEGKSVADKGPLPQLWWQRRWWSRLGQPQDAHHLGVECKKSHASWIVLDK
uniref:Uncharacterized protein n=1 Tax=Zea mays TaxID=4577 RepID=A0A804UDX3_MAIZE